MMAIRQDFHPNDNHNGSGDAVLTEFAQTPNANLTEWMNRYPAHARELARFAAEDWAGENAKESDTTTATVTRLKEIGLASLRARRTAGTVTVAAGTFSSLTAAVAAQGLDAETVAAKLQIPYALFFKLHRRLISPDSVPAAFVRSLADAINRTADEVSAYLRQPPTLAAGASYRADDTPTVGPQEDFAIALRSDPESTDAQVARWLEE
jgi:hypothetical protein